MEKKFFVLITLCIFISCASTKKITLAPNDIILPHSYVKKPEPKLSSQNKMPDPKNNRSFLKCEEKTGSFFNSSGIEVLPFMRAIFYDIDNDGIEEMIAGSKD